MDVVGVGPGGDTLGGANHAAVVEGLQIEGVDLAVLVEGCEQGRTLNLRNEARDGVAVHLCQYGLTQIHGLLESLLGTRVWKDTRQDAQVRDVREIKTLVVQAHVRRGDVVECIAGKERSQAIKLEETVRQNRWVDSRKIFSTHAGIAAGTAGLAPSEEEQRLW